MASQVDDRDESSFDTELKSTEGSSQLSKIKQILVNHDQNGKIACQVNQCLIDDAITLELLSNFDDKSLEKTVYSWKLDTFKEKPFIICGLLINGFKQLKLPSSVNMNNPSNSSTGDVNINTISEKESDMMSKLTQFENIILSKIESFNNEAKEREDTKTKLKTGYQSQINLYFDQIMTKLTQRKKSLLKKLDRIFNTYNQEETNYISKIQLIKDKINVTKNKYTKSLKSSHNNISLDDINTRSKNNCQMIKNLLDTYDKPCIKDTGLKTNYNCEFVVLDVHKEMLASITPNLGDIMDISNVETTIIDSPTVLESDIVHKYGILKIVKGGTITVPGWNEKTNCGGKLLIHCHSLIMEDGAKIDLKGKGYKGGQVINNVCYQGYSYNGTPRCSNNPNFGGGGCFGGGGTYTKEPSSDNRAGNGNYSQIPIEMGKFDGKSYGDETLSTLHLGSGGGAYRKTYYFSTETMNGSNGGGAILVFARKEIIVDKNACILAEGGNLQPINTVDNNKSRHKVGGLGSGGSIYLKAPKILNNGEISVRGGWNKQTRHRGGYGRCRMDTTKEIVDKHNIWSVMWARTGLRKRYLSFISLDKDPFFL